MDSNVTANLTTSQHYSSLPVDFGVKVFAAILYSTVGVYAVFANLLVLYFKKMQQAQKRKENQRAFSRNITNIFVRSLAWSDMLCGLVTFPLTIVTFFIDILRCDWGCRSVRYANFVFPVITSINLFVIGIERYVGIFHPFIAPSNGTVKKLVVGAWIFGMLVSIFPSAMFSANRHDVGQDTYTLTCVVNTDLFYIRIMMIIYNFFQYVIPSIILTITNIRILRFLRRREQRQNSQATNPGRKNFAGTNTFVMLIFSFILPYLVCGINAGVKAIFKPRLSYTVDYFVRHLCGLLAYSNSAISPSVMFYTMPDLNQKLKEFFRQLIKGKNPNQVTSSVAVNQAKYVKHSVTIAEQKDASNTVTIGNVTNQSGDKETPDGHKTHVR